eukprot:87547_1
MSIYFFLCFLVIVNVIANDLNWFTILDELQQAKTIWATTGAHTYVFQLTLSSIFSFPCENVPKYVLVKNNVLDRVEYDSQYLQQQNVNCPEINTAQYDTIDGYYNMAINLALEGILDNCNSSVPAATCGGSILFEYNPILHYPTTLRFVLPQVGDEYPLHTFSCLTVYDSSPHIQNFGYECNNFTPPIPWPEQCKTTQDECWLNEQCCGGICSISQWDTFTSVCCYDNTIENSLCRNDFDCCNGYECDDNMNLCVEKQDVINLCGIPKNSGRNKLIKCKWDDDCCDGYKCNKNNRKCVPRYNYGSISNWFRLDEFDETKVYWLLMNLFIMVMFCGYNAMCRKTEYKTVCMDQSDYNKVESEEI